MLSLWQGLLFNSYGAIRSNGLLYSFLGGDGFFIFIVGIFLTPIEIWLYSIAVKVVWNKVVSASVEYVREIDGEEAYAISCLFFIFSIIP